MTKNLKKGISLAVLAAVLYAINAPFSKLLLNYIPPMLMAGLLYLGAGVGMGVVALVRKGRKQAPHENRLTRAELPYTLAMIVLDIAAPICLMLGLRTTAAANASLLNNFEIVATALLALALFKESVSGRLWCGILMITLSCIVLSLEDLQTYYHFSHGSVLILVSCVCWGLENNCTRKLSSKDPLEIVLLKGMFSGGGSVVIGLCLGERITVWWPVAAVLAVGFVAYGLSIFFYVYAQRLLGAARTSAYYAVAPFIGTALSLLIFGELPLVNYWIGLVIMVLGAWLAAKDEPLLRKQKKGG